MEASSKSLDIKRWKKNFEKKEKQKMRKSKTTAINTFLLLLFYIEKYMFCYETYFKNLYIVTFILLRLYCLICTVKPPNSGHLKQQACHEQRTKHLVPNVTIFFKLPTNSGHLSITDKLFKTQVSAIQSFHCITVFARQVIGNAVTKHKCPCRYALVLKMPHFSQKQSAIDQVF